MRERIFILTLITLLTLITVGGCTIAGCTGIKIKVSNGGVFKSTDKAEHWNHVVAIPTVGKNTASIAGVDATKMVFDPQDSQTIYLGTKQHGFFYTYTAGEAWFYANGLPRGEVRAIAVDPTAKNRIYVAIGNEIYRSIDCCRSWERVYFETRSGINISCLAVDSYDPAKVYAGISDGRLLRSTDYGASWLALHDFKQDVRQVLVNQKDTRRIYVVTSSEFFKSVDLGESWQNLTNVLGEFNKMSGFKLAMFDPREENALMMVTRYGILASDNGAETWRAYKLISRPGQTVIYSLALNPHNPNEMYYGTDSALYKTQDGGSNWQSLSLPSSRAPVALLLDPANPSILYMGVATIK